MPFQAFRFEMRPTAAQAQTLLEWVGVTRLVYNVALEQRRDFWRQFRRQTGRTLTWVAQSAEITELRAEFPWIAAAPRTPLEQAVRDLDKAYQAFFAGRAGHPRPRRRGQNDTMRFKGRECETRPLNRKWAAMSLPKLGWVKYRSTRPILGELLTVTITRAGSRWFVIGSCEIETATASPLGASVGIDRGVAQTLALSSGEVFQAPNTRHVQKLRARAQAVAARGKRGSARNRRQKARAAALSARAGRIRTDWCHRTSTDIARRYGVVAIEDLKIKNMTASAKGTLAKPGRNVRQKAGLNRSILGQCWGKFATFLEYKLAERGGVLISVPAAYTSQTCAGCGVVDRQSRKSQAVFACVHCGHEDNADVNAAREILRRSTALLDVEGSHFEPAEASIMAAA